MGMNGTPVSERKHIAFFGCRNAGKSSLLNAVTGQKKAIVSDIPGTTTDPVYKSMELLPAGPVVMIDTPGLDDEGGLGAARIAKALEVLRKTDVAVVVTDGAKGLREEDLTILSAVRERGIPYAFVCNKEEKCDRKAFEESLQSAGISDAEILYTGADSGVGIRELKERIASLAKDASEE